MTWNDLKKFCNELPENELEKNVILWREEEAITDISAVALDEDHYVDKEGEISDGCFPLSDAEHWIRTSPEDYPDGIDGFEKVYDKGHPVLWENF